MLKAEQEPSVKEGAHNYPHYKGETQTCYQVPPGPSCRYVANRGVMSVSCLSPHTDPNPERVTGSILTQTRFITGRVLETT